MPGIPTSCRQIVAFPILWTRTMVTKATSFLVLVYRISARSRIDRIVVFFNSFERFFFSMKQNVRNAAQRQCQDAKAEQQSRWRQLRQREKKKKTQTRNGANAVKSFIMRSTVSWNMVVRNDNTTWRIKSCGGQRRNS